MLLKTVLIAAYVSAVLAGWSIQWKVSATLAAITTSLCATGNVTGCIVGAVFTVLQAFLVNWKQGGGGDKDQNLKRQFNYLLTHEDGTTYNHTTFLPVGSRATLEFDGNKVLVYKVSNASVAFGNYLSENSNDHGHYVNKRSDTNEIWGVGADDNLDKGAPSKSEYHDMANDIGSAFNKKNGRICSTVKDGNRKVYDIKWVLQPGSNDPGGSTCGA